MDRKLPWESGEIDSAAAAAAKSLQSCPTVCDPIDGSSLGSSVPGILQARILAAAAESLQSCPTLCDPIDGSPPGSAVPGILQARTLELVAISFSNAWKWKVKVKSLSRVWLFTTPWTAAHRAPLSMGFSRQEYWCGVPSPSPSWEVTLKADCYKRLQNYSTADIKGTGFCQIKNSLPRWGMLER